MRLTRCLPLLSIIVAAVVGALATPATAADAKSSSTSTAAERQARSETATKAFMQGKYEDALATFLDLYVQSDGRPEYLRNIGRCQQKLKRYDRAIDSFKEYLSRAKHLSADERKEVQGFISEMETTVANEKAAAAGGPVVTPVPTAPVPAPAPQPAPPPVIEAQPQPAPAWGPAPAPAPEPYGPAPPPGPNYGPPPAYNPNYAPPPPVAPIEPVAQPAPRHRSKLKTVGIVMVIAAAVLAVGGTAEAIAARSTYNTGKDDGCLTTGGTLCNQKADSVASSVLASEILYVGAGLAGAAGVTMIAIAPSSTPEARVGLTASWRF